MKNILLMLACTLWMCSCNTEKNSDADLEKDKKGWTPVDTTLIDEQDNLPDVSVDKPKADSTLATLLPSTIYGHIGDKEIQNSDHNTNTGKTIKSVVRVYRKGEHMIGINVSDFSQLDLKERKELFDYHFKTLQKLSSKKETKYQSVKISKTVSGKILYSKSLNKAIIILSAEDELLITISSDTHLDFLKFKEIINSIDFKTLYKIKQIS